jgi:type III pantothenate kinase
MRLLIDIGNSRLKWSWQTQNQLGPIDAVAYDIKTLAAMLPVLWQEEKPPQQVWVASVAKPTVNSILDQFLASQWGVSADYIHATQSALGVINAYTDPKQLGSDRWASMLAAYNQEHQCVMIVDCGSAVTIDAIDSEGHHLGGTISPGIRLSNTALNLHTNLHWHENECVLPDKLFAISTAEAIMTGIGHGIIGLIGHAHQQLIELGHHPIIYLTGGDAPYISKALHIEHKHVEDLVLVGLALFADHA